MANYPAYPYQPQMGGFGQQMQPMYQPQIYQPAAQQRQEINLFCRPASTREEVLGAPVDYTGNPMTFIGPNQQIVWIKTFNPNTGASEVVEFHRSPPAEAPADKGPAFVTMPDFERLQGVVMKLSEEVSTFRPQRRRVNKEQEEAEDAL